MALDFVTQKKFRNAFEQNCLRLLMSAYELSRTEKIIQLNWNENDISQELAEKIEANPQRKKWTITVSREFHLPKNDVIKKKGFADKLPRIDFKMSRFSKKDECSYYCEAKRLKQSDSSLKRAYISEGMERFISTKYPSGCMLGYLVEGDPDNTIVGINSLLEKDKRKSESLMAIRHKICRSYFESKHTDALIIKHLIFDFTS